jgi:hypothetical protein
LKPRKTQAIMFQRHDANYCKMARRNVERDLLALTADSAIVKCHDVTVNPGFKGATLGLLHNNYHCLYLAALNSGDGDTIVTNSFWHTEYLPTLSSLPR